MVSPAKKRFSITLSRTAHDRLVAFGASQRPRLTKTYLIELAVNRLLEDIDNDQLELPLSRRRRRNAKG